MIGGLENSSTYDDRYPRAAGSPKLELPEAVTKVPPEYPDAARQASVEGTVLMRVLVGKDGRVKDARVGRSIPLLDDAAEKAVRQWVFKPALSDNKPVALWVAVPVRFTLR